jgi:CBS domain-containing protein
MAFRFEPSSCHLFVCPRLKLRDSCRFGEWRQTTGPDDLVFPEISLAAKMQDCVWTNMKEVNMRVAEAMTRDVVSVPVDATLVEAAELMKRYDIGFLPVIAADIVVGVVTDRDLVIRGMFEHANPYLTPVRSVMSSRPIWCYEYDVLTDAADILADNHVRRLVVVDSNKRLVGLLSLDDLAARMSSDRLLGDLVRHVSAA